MDNMSVISLSSSSSEDIDMTRDIGSPQSSQNASNRLDWLGSPRMQAIFKQIEASTAARRQLTEWACSCSVCETAGRRNSLDLNESEDERDDNDSVTIRVDFEKNSQKPPCVRAQEAQAQNNNKLQNVHKTLEDKAVNGSLLNKSSLLPRLVNKNKKEFCSYLQLMDPVTDPTEDFLSANNRRSNRVKNNDKQKEKTKVVCEKPQEDEVPTLKTFEQLNIDIHRIGDLLKKKPRELLPLPDAQYYNKPIDFEESIKDIVKEAGKFNKKINGNLKKDSEPPVSTKKGKFKFTNDKEVKMLAPKRTKGLYNWRRVNSLRSKGRLKNVPVDGLLLQKKRKLLRTKKKLVKKPLKVQKPKKPQQPVKPQKPVMPTPEDQSRCEIITIVTTPSDEEHVRENADLRNFVDDMLELDHLSEEHRRSLVLSRIFFPNSIANCVKKKSPKEAFKKACKIFSDLSNDNKIRSLVAPSIINQNKEKPEIEQETPTVDDKVQIITEHSYASLDTDESLSDEDEEDEEVERQEEEVASESVQVDNIVETFDEIDPVPLEAPTVKPSPPKSTKQLLGVTPKPKLFVFKRNTWDSGDQNKKMDHSISICNENGAVLGAFYVDHHLVVSQKHIVAFWTQSALGNVLGAQNMWIPLGQANRPALHTTYLQKSSTEMVVAADSYVAYAELWMKEHKSDFRERPIADVFVMVYFWKQGMKEPDKKALQLENIKSNPDDVQYVTVKALWPGTQPKIISSWHSVNGNEKKTEVHSYLLAPDFQTVAAVLHFQSVPHYVSSLHNIEDCDNLVAGSGENRMTLWHSESGYVVATITLDFIDHPLRTLWAKCDRGFFFTLQEGADQELHLIAVNGQNWTWKKLQTYRPQPGFDNLSSVYSENGILVAFYKQGILCWNAQSGEPVMEEVPNDIRYIPSGRYMIMVSDEQVIVKHALSHLLTAEDT